MTPRSPSSIPHEPARAGGPGLSFPAGSAGLAIVLLVTLATACASTSSPAGTLRFRNQPIAWQVNDRQDVATKPAERIYNRTLYHIDGFVIRRLTRGMELRPSTRAANVNALDEVPDSTWFTNRIGVRDMSVAEVRRGPNQEDSPEHHKPWTILGSKVGGTAVGFIMKDARGTRYLLKFDDKKGPEVETAADIIGQRILWAVGYNVPEDDIVYFRREDLVLAPDASKKDAFGHKSPLTEVEFEEDLAKIDRQPDGQYRGLSSKYLTGVPIGPFAREGVRADDRNDTVPHEQRRELRGQYAIFSWLDHTDIQEDNTLDMWIEDARAPGRHHVAHYLLDFGKAFGVMGFFNHWPWVGFAHRLDFRFMALSMVSLGLWKRSWEDVSPVGLPGIGLWQVEHYDPGAWRGNSMYWPHQDRDRFDGFWGAKIIIRFTPEQLRAIVDEARLTDPRSAEYFLRTLIERQKKTARYWFERVNPLDTFTVARAGDRYTVCFDDLYLRYHLATQPVTTLYQAEAFDYEGRKTGWATATQPDQAGRGCLTGLAPADSHDGYTIVRIVTQRGNKDLPPTLVHLAIAPDTGLLRVIGLRRE